MNGEKQQRLEVLLVQSLGAFYFGAGTPQVICRFEAVPPFRTVGEQHRQVSCLVCTGSKETRTWHEYSPTISVEESDEFMDYLAALPLPRASIFPGELDTGAVLQHVFLRVRRDTETHQYDIH